MLQHIRIENFAIIGHAEIDFAPGLNIITGETGAGKSIVATAISLALGARADSSYVRTGASKAVIQLLGDLDDEEILITREVSASGRNLCRLNGELVTLSQLQQVCRRLADIHGQYDNQSLLDPAQHIQLVDAYRRDITQPCLDAYRQAYTRYLDVRRRLGHLLTAQKDLDRRKDLLRFEASEIEAAHLSPGEDERLAARISVLQNGERIYEALSRAYDLLQGEEGSVMNGLQSASGALDSVAAYAPALHDLSETMQDALYSLEDVCRDLRGQLEGLTFDPGELNAAQERLAGIDALKKKYGGSIEAVLSHYETVSASLASMASFASTRATLETELKQAAGKLRAAADALTAARRAAAQALGEAVERELADLNFAEASLSIQLTSLSKPAENGQDQVEIMLSTNRGEPLKPLARIASGGEMSRIMLAFKTVISGCDAIPTLVFDEIDSGISGVTASIVGRKLKKIAETHQILCITHLPQIAACGDAHFRIYKDTDADATYTHVDRLSEAETVAEIARLLGGDTVTETTLESAGELLAASRGR